MRATQWRGAGLKRPPICGLFSFILCTAPIIALAAILAALVTTVLYVVWYFNKSIPGLRWWTLSFLCASVFCTHLLVREHLPELVSVVLTQIGIALAAYFCFLGSRLYVSRSLPFHGYAVAATAAVVGLSVYFTLEHSHTGIRFALSGLVAGFYFIATATTLAQRACAGSPLATFFPCWSAPMVSLCCCGRCCSGWPRQTPAARAGWTRG